MPNAASSHLPVADTQLNLSQWYMQYTRKPVKLVRFFPKQKSQLVPSFARMFSCTTLLTSDTIFFTYRTVAMALI